jgi:hypothetical protein
VGDAERAKRKELEAKFAWDGLDELEAYRHVYAVRLANVVEVREPLVLVSQVQRSGGTLLSQLFDGHPECHAHPYEVHLRPEHEDPRWPKLRLDKSPQAWFDVLYEHQAARHLLLGYSKPGRKVDVDVHPFLFLPRLQKEIFERCVASKHITRDRDIYDCYFTSYFNAWLDNQNLYTGPKKVITGFTPRAVFHAGSVGRFFRSYPDGKLMSIVRDPRAWYASASKHRPQYQDVERAMKLWRRSANAGLKAHGRHGDRVILLTYEELVEDTEATMSRLAERLGITMLPILLTPTFNGRLIRPNSSDAVQAYGVRRERVRAYRDDLTREQTSLVDELADDLYDRFRALPAA